VIWSPLLNQVCPLLRQTHIPLRLQLLREHSLRTSRRIDYHEPILVFSSSRPYDQLYADFQCKHSTINTNRQPQTQVIQRYPMALITIPLHILLRVPLMPPRPEQNIPRVSQALSITRPNPHSGIKLLREKLKIRWM
jgi:hypothetical protein